jgi:two-component system, chemotaxis family, sensor kinase CheA
MDDRSEKLRKRLLATFRVEADEHVRSITSELTALTASPAAADAQQRLETLFRTVHTLKGAARSVGIADIEQFCHAWEARLRDLRKGGGTFDQPALELFNDAADLVAQMVGGSTPKERLVETTARLEARPDRARPPSEPAVAVPPENVVAPAPANGTAASAPRAATNGAAEPVLGNGAGTRDSIRVEVRNLDRLMVLTEDLLVPKLSGAVHTRTARDIAEGVARLRGTLRGTKHKGKAKLAGTDFVAGLEDALRKLELNARQLAGQLASDHKLMRMTADDLIAEARRLRMLPAGSILEAFPRMVRDLARETGKEVVWQVAGASLNVDRKILDLVKDPLMHMVRNAVDHGIELPDERVALGKPRTGKVSVSITSIEGGRVAIEVADDGRGIDVAAVKSAAIRSKALTAEQAGNLRDEEATNLIYRSGVSTASVITRISGHGIGLAVVRDRVESLDGRIATRTAQGIGTTIHLDLPANIATYRGLQVKVAGASFLWPVDSIERTIGVRARDLADLLGRGLISHNDETLPFGRLSAILGLPARDPKDDPRREWPAVVVHNGAQRGVILVDELVGLSEVLIKEFRPPLRRVLNVAAAGLLGNGELALVLRPSDVLQSIHIRQTEGVQQPSRREDRQLKLLVVDDSITTRTMERNMFEAAGYRVLTAANGLEAWQVLQSEGVDLVVSDVDMPVMDGFELTTRIREDSARADLPVVLVTALEAREDKERGLRVGANAYVLKSTFDQSNLLEIIGRLV